MREKGLEASKEDGCVGGGVKVKRQRGWFKGGRGKGKCR